MSADIHQLRLDLVQSIQQLSNRCLYQAAKWSGEALNSLALDQSTRSQLQQGTSRDIYLPEIPSDQYLFAKTLFDSHEYDRCAFVLADVSSTSKSHENHVDYMGLFLKLYAKYMSGEIAREADQGSILGPKDNQLPNLQVVDIIQELEQCEGLVDDPFLLYLYGIVLKRQKSESKALDALAKSVILFPYNMSAWKEILSCISTVDELQQYYDDKLADVFDDTVAGKIFTTHAFQEFFRYDQELLTTIDMLQERYFSGGFNFLDVQKALINYHGLNYEDAEKQFDQVILRDPYRIDDLDTYSNILYVMERTVKLTYLAQLSTKVDKFRPETCVIVANHYSLKSEHEKAIVYFQRALALNRNCLSAWTLMGHEFVELKNTHAAIESYRRAVDANKRDFRAWYGLGQAYEVLEMHYYSLYYYERAAALKPFDVRMWVALANSYEKLDRIDEAIKGFKQALNVGDYSDPMILYRIALLYEKQVDVDNTVRFMKLCIAEEPNIDPATDSGADSIAHATMWLAKHELKIGNSQKAYDYAEKITRGSAIEVEEARNIMKEAKHQMRADLFKT